MDYKEMKKQDDEHPNNIELRSDKIRNIIGQMPPFLVRWGNTVLLIVFILLCLAFFIIAVSFRVY